MICPLCQGSDHHKIDQDKYRSFFKCHTCELIFVPREALISEMDEKHRYEAHENDEADAGYSAYLKSISDTIRSHINPGERGLDFGCGRTKLLARHLSPHEVQSYDVYFHPDSELLDKKYDFVVLSEVIEHLRNPKEEMLELAEIGKKFFIKTKCYPETGFSDWFYKRDITHVQFFNPASFKKLAQICSFSGYQEIGKDLYLFKK